MQFIKHRYSGPPNAENPMRSIASHAFRYLWRKIRLSDFPNRDCPQSCNRADIRSVCSWLCSINGLEPTWRASSFIAEGERRACSRSGHGVKLGRRRVKPSVEARIVELRDQGHGIHKIRRKL